MDKTVIDADRKLIKAVLSQYNDTTQYNPQYTLHFRSNQKVGYRFILSMPDKKFWDVIKPNLNNLTLTYRIEPHIGTI